MGDSINELQIRVCVTGAECTGKSSLAAAIAAHFGAPVIGEFGRPYFETKIASGDPMVTTADVVAVARGQAAMEREAAASDAPLVIHDTDTFTVAVWNERYLLSRSREADILAQELIELAPMHLYLLCAPDIPWEPDDIRSHAELRSDMHHHFVRRHEDTDRPVLQMTGDWDTRLARSVEAIEALLR